MIQAKCHVATRDLEINRKSFKYNLKTITNLRATVLKEILRNSSEVVVSCWETRWTPSVPASKKLYQECVWKDKNEADHSLTGKVKFDGQESFHMVTHEQTFGSITGKLSSPNHSKLPGIQHQLLLWTDTSFYVMPREHHLVLM